MCKLNAFGGAALAIAMAALSYSPSALAQGFDHEAMLTGYWGWVEQEDDPADFSGTCDNHPMRVWFTEAGGRFHSQWALDVELGHIATSPVYASVLNPDGRGMIHLAYDGEERIDDQGNRVSWYLVMLDNDAFVWVRNDWVNAGGNTRAMVRCKEWMVS